MKVLLIGATGNLGLRLVPALLRHGHSVVAYVRSSNKLQSALPASICSQLAIVEGNATDTAAIKSAILDTGCDAVVNTAGVAVAAPWGKTDLPVIFSAVVGAAREAGVERNKPLRAWFLAGMGVMKLPGSEALLSDYMPIFLAHRQNFRLLESVPRDALDWSLLCPSTMLPSRESADINRPTEPSQSADKIVANATYPPLWQDSWVKHIPLIGKTFLCAMNFPRYETTLEQNAEFIAGDLESSESQWSRKTVCVIKEAAKQK